MFEQTLLPKCCEEKAVLLRAWVLATTAYSEAVAILSHDVGVWLHADYELVKGKVAIFREVDEEAFKRFEEHQRQHNC